jgi:hypothetical protein
MRRRWEKPQAHACDPERVLEAINCDGMVPWLGREFEIIGKKRGLRNENDYIPAKFEHAWRVQPVASSIG